MINKLNKKGMAQMFIFLIFVGALIFFMFTAGSISGFLIKHTFGNIPTWFWVGLIFFVLMILGRRKK